MVDTLVLGTSAAMRGGSSPLARTKVWTVGRVDEGSGLLIRRT